MSDINRLKQALIAADAAGDTAAATKLATALRGMQKPVPKAASAPAEEYDPSAGGGTLQFGPWDTGIKTPQGVDRFLSGTGRGIMNIGRNIGNVVGLVDDSTLKDANATDAKLLATGAGQAGNFLGETAALTPLTLGFGAGANALRAGSLASKVLTNPLARGAIEGAGQGALSAGPGNRGEGALIGGVTGTAIPALGSAVGKVARGLKRTPEAQRLLDEGVSLTPGQMNPKGMFNHAEEAMQSFPLVGSAIKNARGSAEDDFRRAVIQRGSFDQLPKSGAPQDLLDSAYQSFSPLYDQAKGVPMRPPSDVDLTHAVSNVNIFADDAARAKVAKYVSNQITALKTTRPDSGDLLKIRSNVRQAARDAAKDPTRGAEASLLNEVDKTLSQTIHSQLPHDAQTALNRADNRYGLYKIAEKAVAKGRDRPGGFTPTMLAQSIKESTPAGAYARGGGRLRDLSQAGGQVFETRSPPTGARLGVMGLLGGASIFHPSVGLPALGGVLGLSATKTGRNLAAGQTGAQKALQSQIQKLTGATPAQARELLSIYSRGLLTSSAVTNATN